MFQVMRKGVDTHAMIEVALISFSCVDACVGSPAEVEEWLKMSVACLGVNSCPGQSEESWTAVVSHQSSRLEQIDGKSSKSISVIFSGLRCDLLTILRKLMNQNQIAILKKKYHICTFTSSDLEILRYC